MPGMTRAKLMQSPPTTVNMFTQQYRAVQDHQRQAGTWHRSSFDWWSGVVNLPWHLTPLLAHQAPHINTRLHNHTLPVYYNLLVYTSYTYLHYLHRCTQKQPFHVWAEDFHTHSPVASPHVASSTLHIHMPVVVVVCLVAVREAYTDLVQHLSKGTQGRQDGTGSCRGTTTQETFTTRGSW